MLLGSTAAFDGAQTETAGASDAAAIGDRLLACITKAFPALPVGTSRVESAGGDHLLLIIDDAYAFRFPRAGMHDLKLEIQVLELLQRRSIMPIPSYDYVDPAGRFAGYRFIAGVELTPCRFAALSPAAKDRVLSEAASFLSELHGLPIDAVGWSGTWPMAWTAAEFADRALAERLPLIVAHAPHLAGPIEAFFRAYRSDHPDHPVVVHGDLVAEHILYDQSAERLAGIIDFGDVALGDPAQDFIGFWSYGEEAAARIVELYSPDDTDPGLLGRARNCFIRHRIDRLCEDMSGATGEDARRAERELDALISPFGSC